MIFVIGLPAALVNVRYRWLADGVLGGALSAGITQIGTFPLFRISAVPPADAEELIVYDNTDETNFSLARYASLAGAGGASAAEIADAVFEETAADHNTAGSMGAKLNAAGSSGDPLANLVPGDYGPGTAGRLIAKLNVGEVDAPVAVIPTPSVDLSVCRVFGYFETLDNKPAENTEIKFTLVAADPTKSERIISGRTITVKTDENGRLIDSEGNFYLELQRNDLLTPSDTTYKVSSGLANLENVSITLDAATFDLASVIPLTP